jgi:hypothetical protein
MTISFICREYLGMPHPLQISFLAPLPNRERQSKGDLFTGWIGPRQPLATGARPWAFVEAANFAKRYDDHCRKWFDRKAAKTSKVLATKALACKLAKAAWDVMVHDTDYDPKRMFPELAQSQTK